MTRDHPQQARRHVHLTRGVLALTAMVVGVVSFGPVPFAHGRSLPQDGSGRCDQNTTAYMPDAAPGPAALGLDNAHAYSRGANVTVAVVDSGVASGNSHLDSVLLPGVDLVDKSDGRTDVYGMGTAIAGLVAAQPVAGSGLVGVAPDAKILPVRVYVQMQANSGATPSHVPSPAVTAQGITWAADHGAQIIVVPTPFTADDTSLHLAVSHAHDVGSLVIAPVGDASTTNGGAQTPDTTMRYPAAYTDVVLGVTGVDATGQATPATVHNSSVRLAVPGSGVISTFYNRGDCEFTADSPSSLFAVGYAAGLAALIASRYPQETPDDWTYRLLVTAVRPLPAQRDDDIGWGLADPLAALTFINDGTAAGPPNPRGDAPADTVPRPHPPGHVQSNSLPDGDRIALIVCAAAACLVALVAPLLVAKARKRD